MKNVFFIRHAKSSWADMSLSDFDRPLNKRGLRDAPFMASLLLTKTSKIDCIVSSTANRAFTTATYFAKKFDIQLEDIQLEPSLYHPSPDDVFKVIHSLNNEYENIAIFGHNPAWTTIANAFSDDYIPNIPTVGIFKIGAPINSWEDFTTETGKFSELYCPKMYF